MGSWAAVIGNVGQGKQGKRTADSGRNRVETGANASAAPGGVRAVLPDRRTSAANL
ncbi:hypothetical protein BURMUCF2_1484 [Burkholderia multivorans CF2]|nr:hypothetical protein BURMUCF2_1484 [Burkholderia multivorans CF2]